jgi:hypothetical protein
MNSNIIPTFRKVELLVKTVVNDVVMPSLSKVEFEDAGMFITGNYVVITTKEYNEEIKEVIQTSKIFHLNEINSYRTHNKK